MKNILLPFGYLKKSTLALSILTAGSLLFSLSKMKNFGKDSTFDYFTANTLYTKWKASPEKVDLLPLESLLSRKKDLHSKFDASIAQHLLTLGKAGIAESYVMAVFNRNKESPPYFIQFATISLRIAKEEYLLALKESTQLKKELSQKSSSLLHAYNLVRIAILEGKTGEISNELKAWEEVLENEHFPLLEQSIQADGLSLLDYIQHRKQVSLQNIKRTSC